MTEQVQKPLFLQLQALTLEDLHTGTGTGGGDVDALVTRDRRGRPVIRASHLKGLLREAGEELIHHQSMTEGELNALLGARGSGRGALRLTSLRSDQKAETLIWGSSAREKGSRAPKEDTLRYIEHIAAGTRFMATLRLADPGLASMLEALLPRIDRIGGGRNRGGGLVRLTWSRQEDPTPEPPVVEMGGLALRLILRNLEPLCLPATGHPGNLIRSHSFIRGQTLRGALLAWGIQNGRPAPPDFWGRLSVGDALPLPTDLSQVAEVLPIPLCILTKKPVGGDPNLPWWAAGAAEPKAFDNLYHEHDEEEEKPKRPGAHEYLCRASVGGPWRRYEPTMKVRLRNATPRRGNEEKANLFSLEEIAEGTGFQVELRFTDQEAREAFIRSFKPLLAGQDWLAVGRGGTPVVVEAIHAATEPGVGDVSASTGAGMTDDWTLTLTSDLIARGPDLGFLDNLDIRTLCLLAGIDTPADGQWLVKKAAPETERLYGFNAASGLQRAPALALRRGSCWRIGGTGSSALAAALVERGAVGERTREGLGHFRIGAEPFTNLVKEGPSSKRPGPNRGEVLLARARDLADRARDLANQTKDKSPSLSQLQWLREGALAAGDAGQLDKLLLEIEQAPERRPQGGKPWKVFPRMELRRQLDLLEAENRGDPKRALEEKRLLISNLVQWRAPSVKEQLK
jgi:hypothetical protein